MIAVCQLPTHIAHKINRRTARRSQLDAILPKVPKHSTSLPSGSAARLRGPLSLALLCLAFVLSACGNTLQDQSISSSVLEQLVMVRQYPVYWLGSSFRKMRVTNVLRDPSGAFTIQYGDCVEGGQSTCVPPLAVVTSPDNSFHPVGETPTTKLSLRDVQGLLTQNGKTIEIPTGEVVVDLYADNPALARAAAQRIVPINQQGLPGAPLPRALPNTGFAEQPLVSQTPPPIPQTSG